MGDLHNWFPKSNGALIEGRSVSPSSSPSLCPNPTSIGTERWRVAEQATHGIISQIQPTVVSEVRRREVIDYVQRLIRLHLGCEVFPYGSVPLKTYLPDGDIDLSAFVDPIVVDSLADGVFTILQGEEQNSDAEFVVRDVQVINAEVKLVKCLVQNIVVDISFNQLGGLCTLCFLEKVDRLISKDHIFKQSIILTKAWCFYESRILGAIHGLISTYALETLVLYIFHLFHSSLNGPLEVLYRFLDYFSNFDWDTYSISVNGPIRLSSLPQFMSEKPDNVDLNCSFLSRDFLGECVDMFSVPSRVHESRAFHQKHLNIVDPLKESNNLGRSVSKGNSYRIRSAFTYGARKLGTILSQPEDNVVEFRNFFTNTLDRHGSGERPDVQDCLEMSGFSGNVVSGDGVSRSNSFDSEIRSGECKGVFQNGIMMKMNVGVDIFPKEIPTVSGLRISDDPKYYHSGVDNCKTSNGNSLLHVENGEVGKIIQCGNLISDLSGDYDAQLYSWRYGHSTFISPAASPMPSQLHALFNCKNSWNLNQRLPKFRQDAYTHTTADTVISRPISSVIPRPPIYPFTFAPKPRGTGTYFPIMNHYPLNRPRLYPPRTRNPPIPMIFPPNKLNNAPSPEGNLNPNQVSGNIVSTNFLHSESSDGKKHISAPNGVGDEKVAEMGYFGDFESGLPLCSNNNPSSSVPKSTIPNSSGPGMLGSKPVVSENGDRVSTIQLYRLKDEDDFPPLSG